MFYQQLLCPICKSQLQIKVEFGDTVMPHKHYICGCGYALRTETYDPNKSIKQRVDEMLKTTN